MVAGLMPSGPAGKRVSWYRIRSAWRCSHLVSHLLEAFHLVGTARARSGNLADDRWARHEALKRS